MNCGTPTHSADCLCDVVITEPVATLYHFTDVMHGPLVARALGYKGAGHADLADYLEALSAASDAAQRLKGLDEGWMDDVISSDLRSRVAALLQEGHSIIDVPDLLGESFTRVVASTSFCQPAATWLWSELRWLEWEAAILTGAPLNHSHLAQRFELTRHQQIPTLLKMYGVGDDRRKRLDLIAQIIDAHEGKPPAYVLARIKEAGIHDLTRNALQKQMAKRSKQAA